jgi:hypothetical protein
MDSLKRSTAALAAVAPQIRKTLVTVLGSATLLVAVSPTAKADAFLSLQNGALTLSCNTSIAFSAVNCGAGFNAVLGGNSIGFFGTVGGYSVANLALATNSPGNPDLAFVTDTKTAVANVSAGATALTVLFAVNNFALPAGSFLIASASQSGTFADATAGSSQNFTAWANALNTLGAGPGNGTVVTTPNCVSTLNAPPAQACATQSNPVLFARTGNFALNGREIINLNQGGNASFTGTIAATAVPEPGSIVLVATGLFGLVGGRRVFRRKA